MASKKRSVSFPEEQLELLEAIREAFGEQGEYAAAPDRSKVIQDLVDEFIEAYLHLLDPEFVAEHREYLDEKGIDVPEELGVDTGNPTPIPGPATSD